MFFVGIALLLISLVLAIGSQVMLALCIYNDAKARGDQNAVLFAVLSGVLGIIPAIIYLVLRCRASPRCFPLPQLRYAPSQSPYHPSGC